MTSLDPHYAAGRAFHHAGGARSDNSNEADPVRHEQWDRGWTDGEAEWAPSWHGAWPDDIGL